MINFDLAARQFGVPAELLQQLVASGGLQLGDTVEPQNEYQQATTPMLAVTSPQAATALVDAGLNSLDPSITGLSPDLNRMLSIALLLEPFQAINDGSAFAKYGFTDQNVIQQLQQGNANLEDYRNQSKTAGRRAGQGVTKAAALAFGGAGALELAGAPGTASAAQASTSLGLPATIPSVANAPSLGLANSGTQLISALPEVAAPAAGAAAAGEAAGAGAGVATGAGDAAAFNAANWAGIDTAAGAGAGAGVSTLAQIGTGIKAGIEAITPSKETIDTGLKVAGILGSAAVLGGIGKTIAQGGTTITETKTTTPPGANAPPPAANSPEVTLPISVTKDLTTASNQYQKLDPVVQAQLDAWYATLQRSNAHDPGVIATAIGQLIKNPNLTWEEKQTQLAAAMRQYGVTVTEVADATGYSLEEVMKQTGVGLTSAEKYAQTQQQIADFQVKQMNQGTAATPEQSDLIDTAFFGNKYQRPGVDSKQAISDFVTQTFNDPNMTMQQKGDAIRAGMLKYGVNASQVAAASGYTPADVKKYAGIDVVPGEPTTMQPGGAYGAGLSEIDRFTQETLRRINEEVAPASGLNLNDSPIKALYGTPGTSTGKVGTGLLGETTRQQGILLNNMTSGAANAKLNYPLAAAQVSNATANSAGNLNMAAQAFQADLAQQAQNNRYRLFSSPYQLPTPNAAGMAANYSLALGNQRLGLGSTTTSSSQFNPIGLSNYANLALGLGGVISGLSRMSGP